MKNHSLRMIIGCGLPLLLIFILPALGISSSLTFFIFIILMFGCHFLMMGSHHKKHEEHEEKEEGYGNH